MAKSGRRSRGRILNNAEFPIFYFSGTRKNRAQKGQGFEPEGPG